MTSTLVREIPFGFSENDPKIGWGILKTRVEESDLLNRQPLFYLSTIAFDLTLLVCGMAFVTLLGSLWLVPVVAVYFAFVVTRWGFLLHDAGHVQIFSTVRANDKVGLFASLVTGGGYSWWKFAHNQHHKYPNDPKYDPDAKAVILELITKIRSSNIPGVSLFVTSPVLFAIGMRGVAFIWLKLLSIKYLIDGKARYQLVETVIFLLHHSLYFVGLLWFLGSVGTIEFVVIHHIATGFYFASIFAPNHKGMAVFEDSRSLDFLTLQVSTTRNTISGRIGNIFTGGLAQQTEHHLFATMPRNNLPQAEKMCREEIEKVGLTFTKVSFWRAQKEALAAFRVNKA